MSEDVLEFYETLGFEETEIEDGLTALFFEVSPEENYVLITDEDGLIPENLKKTVIFACYTPEGAFLWNTSFKNSHMFKDLWSEAQTPEHKIDTIRKHCESSNNYDLI